MKERPILFSAPMVKAILDGRKNQTRRVVKPQPRAPKATYDAGIWSDTNDPVTRYFGCPHGVPGDILWIREAFTTLDCHHGQIAYRATDEAKITDAKWKPSIHMPRSASRITLEITGVRVERLREISMADVIAEGLCLSTDKTDLSDFQNLWESINGPGSWALNPWVWCLTFQRIKP